MVVVRCRFMVPGLQGEGIVSSNLILPFPSVDHPTHAATPNLAAG